MRLALTGGRGFLGRHLLRKLLAQGWDVQSYVRPESKDLLSHEVALDFSDLESVEAELSEFLPTVIVYLASTTSPGRRIDDFAGKFEAEVVPMVNFARAAPASVKAAIFSGSCEEYGNGPVPFLEDQPQSCFSSYGWAKIAAHHAVKYVSMMRCLPWVWIRPFLLYGPGQTGRLLMPSLARAIREGRALDLSPGDQTRDFIFVEDCVEMLMCILANPEPALGQSLNLCSGIPRRVREVGDLMLKIGGGSARLNWGAISYRDHEAMEFYGSTAKFERLYCKPICTDFRESLALTLGNSQ